MEYIIKTNSYRLLKEKLNELTKDIDKDNITYLDLTENSIKEIIEECNYTSLFDDKKAIVVNNTNIFNTKYEYKDELEILEKYLNNPNSNTTLVFIADSVSKKKKCVKIINDNNNYFELNSPMDDELKSCVKDYLKKNSYKIETSALNLLLDNLENKYDYILNELDKVMIVKKDYLITKEDIEKYTISTKCDNIFDFVEYIVKKNETKMIEYLERFINDKNEPAILLSNVATQYRLIYSTKNLSKEGYSEKEIAEMLDVHPYRVKLAKNNSYNYTNSELKERLLYIGKLDEQIKLGLIDKYIALKMFIISINR